MICAVTRCCIDIAKGSESRQYHVNLDDMVPGVCSTLEAPVLSDSGACSDSPISHCSRRQLPSLAQVDPEVQVSVRHRAVPFTLHSLWAGTPKT
jgi:hypothetical protein